MIKIAFVYTTVPIIRGLIGLIASKTTEDGYQKSFLKDNRVKI